MQIEYEPLIKGKTFVAKIIKNQDIEKYMQLKITSTQEIQKSIVKGVFMGAGSITNPEKQYHLEIIFQEKNNAEYILNICKSFGVFVIIPTSS